MKPLRRGLSSQQGALCGVAVWLGLPKADLEWGVVLIIVSQSVHKNINLFLIMGTDKTQLGLFAIH